MVDRLPVSIVGANGDVIEFTHGSSGYVIEEGTRGLGIAPTELTMTEGAGDGGIARYVRRGARDIDLPVTVLGASRGEVLARQRRLVAALRSVPGGKTARLRFTLESGAVYELGVFYVTGAETQVGSDTGSDTFTRWAMTLRAPSPFWVAVDDRAVVVKTGDSGRGLLPHLSRLQVSSSQVLGDLTVTNPGDVPAPVRWTLTGPGGPFTARAETGEGFVFEPTLAAGETVTIDGETGAVTDQDGRNRYADLGPAPKFFPLPAGTSTLSISLTNATSASRVVGLYRPRLEVVY